MLPFSITEMKSLPYFVVARIHSSFSGEGVALKEWTKYSLSSPTLLRSLDSLLHDLALWSQNSKL